MTKKEMEEQIHSFAELIYKTGYDDGLTEGIKNTYNKGLDDVWKYVEKLGQLTIKEIYEVFGVEYDNIYGIIADYTPSEFIKAIKAYEEQLKAPSEATICSILEDDCPYDIKCEECEVHCSIERSKRKLKGDKE